MLGRWQKHIAEMTVLNYPDPVLYCWVQPIGKAAQYGGRYLDSFRKLNNVEFGGYTLVLGPYGPRGGRAIKAMKFGELEEGE